jgi:hypothetical protein
MSPHEALERYCHVRSRVLELKRGIAQALAEAQRAQALADKLEGNLKRARVELVEASNALPRAVHCDLAGVLGQDPATVAVEAPV